MFFGHFLLFMFGLWNSDFNYSEFLKCVDLNSKCLNKISIIYHKGNSKDRIELSPGFYHNRRDWSIEISIYQQIRGTTLLRKWRVIAAADNFLWMRRRWRAVAEKDAFKTSTVDHRIHLFLRCTVVKGPPRTAPIRNWRRCCSRLGYR